MQQLQVIFVQRNGDIEQMESQQNKITKQQFQLRQRARIHKQNWLIKAIRNNNVFTHEQKKNIYEITLRIMKYYLPMLTAPLNVNLEKNFMVEMINLFSRFYNKQNQIDLVLTKKTNKLNNVCAMVDLQKQLLETHRQYFKSKLLVAFKEILKEREDKVKSSLLFPTMATLSVRTTERIETQGERQQLTKKSSKIGYKIKQQILQKWQHYIQTALPKQTSIKIQVNELYVQLMQRNSQNQFLITRFQQKCYGRRRFAFNVSGLYSQQQLKKMQYKLKYDIKEKYSKIKQLKGNPTMEQLRQYFKIKVEIQENIDTLQSTRIQNNKINSWVPLIISKSQTQDHPFNVYVIFNKEQVGIEEFPLKCGLSLRNFMKLIVKDKIEKQKEKYQIPQIKSFKKHHFLDLNHSKKKQLMSQLDRTYSRNKKLSIFPLLRNNQLKQQSQIAIKNRSMSEHKVGQLNKKQTFCRKFSENQEESLQYNDNRKLKIHQSQILLKKISVHLHDDYIHDKAKWSEKKNLDGFSKSKIDSVNVLKLILRKKM